MKIRLFAKTLLAVLFCSSTFAAADVDRSWANEHRYAIAVDPVSWVGGNFKAQIEFSINDRLSFNMPLSFGVKETIFKNGYFAGTYFAPRFGVKYYVTGKATHQGFYVNPLVGVFMGKLDTTPASDTTGGLSYGFRFGFAWNMWRGLWLDSYVGLENLVTTFNSDKNGNGNGNGGKIPVGEGFLMTQGFGALNAGLMLGYNW